MSTSSRIGVVNDDQTITSIYCHFDGYPEGVGATLLEHWTDPAKVRALIALGDISVLREEVGEKHDFDWQLPYFSINAGAKERAALDADPRSKWTMAYGRDRGEKGTRAKKSANLSAFRSLGDNSNAEYTYLFIDGQWNCWDGRHHRIELKVEA